MNYKEELLNDIEYKKLYNDFYNIKSKNTQKGKDNEGNLVFISSNLKYVLYHSKYKELYQYLNELIENKLKLIDKITHVKHIIINDYDNNELKKEFNNLYKEYENINTFLNDTYNNISEFQINENEKNDLEEKIKSLENELEKNLTERNKILKEKNNNKENNKEENYISQGGVKKDKEKYDEDNDKDDKDEKIKELNSEIINLFKKNKGYYKNKKNLISNSTIPRVIKTRNAFVRYYDKLDVSIIKLKIKN